MLPYRSEKPHLFPLVPRILGLLWRAVLLAGLLFLQPWTYALGQGIISGPAKIDFILLIDNSPSMSNGTPEKGIPPSDPDNLRFRIADLFVKYLRDEAARTGGDYRVAVISFGDELHPETPSLLSVQAITSLALDIYTRTIQGTDFVRSLTTTLETFQRESADFDRKKAVILLTDGEPEPELKPGDETTAYFSNLQSVTDKFRREGFYLFVLGFGQQGWQAHWIPILPPGNYMPVERTVNNDGLYAIFRRIVGSIISISDITPTAQPTYAPTLPATPTVPPTSLPISTPPIATPTPDASVLGIPGANHNLVVGIVLGVLFVTLLLMRWFIPRQHARGIVLQACTLAELHNKRQHRRDTSDTYIGKMFETSGRLAREIGELLDKCFKDPVLVQTWNFGQYLSGRLSELHPKDSSDLGPLSQITASAFSAMWGTQENEKWGTPENRWRVGLWLLDIVIRQRGDPGVVMWRFCDEMWHKKLPSEIKACVEFFRYWSRQATTTGNVETLRNVEKLLGQAISPIGAEQTLSGLVGFGNVGNEWLKLFQSLNQIYICSTLQDAVQNWPQVTMSFQHWDELVMALRALEAWGRCENNKAAGYTQLEEQAKKALSALPPFHYGIIVSIFGREGWCGDLDFGRIWEV